MRLISSHKTRVKLLISLTESLLKLVQKSLFW